MAPTPAKTFFDSIEGKPLDDQQRRAVLVNEDNNIIVAVEKEQRKCFLRKGRWLALLFERFAKLKIINIKATN